MAVNASRAVPMMAVLCCSHRPLMQDEMQAIFGMTGASKGNGGMMEQIGGSNEDASNSIANVQNTMGEIAGSVDFSAVNDLAGSIDLSAMNDVADAMNAKFEEVMNLLKIAFGFLQVVSTLSFNLPSIGNCKSSCFIYR